VLRFIRCGVCVAVNTNCETITKRIQISPEDNLLCSLELKKQKPWLDERCSKFLDQKTQANLHRLQVPGEFNGDNLTNVGVKLADFLEI
jgi:hypothetical protein